MPAYMIITAKVSQRDAFINGYGKEAARLVEQFGGKYILRAPNAQLLEGDFGDDASIVISEWPDTQNALKFWHSEEYKAIKKLRHDLAKVQVVLIEAPSLTDALIKV
jgi:uncharacterized protein (DUF1330 family)